MKGTSKVMPAMKYREWRMFVCGLISNRALNYQELCRFWRVQWRDKNSGNNAVIWRATWTFPTSALFAYIEIGIRTFACVYGSIKRSHIVGHAYTNRAVCPIITESKRGSPFVSFALSHIKFTQAKSRWIARRGLSYCFPCANRHSVCRKTGTRDRKVKLGTHKEREKERDVFLRELRQLKTFPLYNSNSYIYSLYYSLLN